MGTLAGNRKGNDMLIELPVEEYLEQAASGKEVPGGGSVSALVGALGSSMASMAANFTVGKKKYAEVEQEVKGILEQLEELMGNLKGYVDKDAEAFLGFNDVYAMPKETDEEKTARDEAMQKTLCNALQPPFLTMKAAAEALSLLPCLSEICNKNLISDVGVAAVMLRAAIEGAHLNVRVNLRYIKDKDCCRKIGKDCEQILQSAPEHAEHTMQHVYNAI